MKNPNPEFKKIYETLRNELRTSNAGQTFRRESKEIKDFYLTDDQRERLKSMKHIKHSFLLFGWIMRAMFRKLTPMRQIMFVVGIVLLLKLQVSFGDTNSFGLDFNAVLGGGLLVLVILLELKDKLLAHDELEEGRHIQELLMPERNPKIEGWSVWLYTRSANEVCGDLIDFLRLENGTVAIAIADVAGKGLHAALLTAKLQATMRALAFDVRPLSTLIGQINTIFHRDSPSNMFASFVFAEFSESRGEIRFVNAGHFPAMIVRDSSIEESQKGEPALGLMRTIQYTEQTTTLNSNDLFILYSDGLTESRNEQGEFFGKERLSKFLASNTRKDAEHIGTGLLIEVDAFVGAASIMDDLSMIILHRK